MSCYVVENNHINQLVAWADSRGHLLAGLTKQDTAQLLFSANVRSVNQRYKLTEPEAFTYTDPQDVPTDTEVLHLIGRWAYQCDCWDGWETSIAHYMEKMWSSKAVAGHVAGGVL